MKSIACVLAAATVVMAGIHEDCSQQVISDYYVDWCHSQCAEVQKTNPQCLGKQAQSITDGAELAKCVAELHFPHCRFLENITLLPHLHQRLLRNAPLPAPITSAVSTENGKCTTTLNTSAATIGMAPSPRGTSLFRCRA